MTRSAARGSQKKKCTRAACCSASYGKRVFKLALQPACIFLRPECIFFCSPRAAEQDPADRDLSTIVKKQPGFEASFDARAARTCAAILFSVFCMLEGQGSRECTVSAALKGTVSAALKDTSRALALRGLSINVSKTVAMVIAPHSRACQGLPTGVRLLLQNEEVKLVSQTRLLGIIIDDSLSWSPHVDSICKKFGRKIGALRRTYRQLTPTVRRQFFVSVIQPDLEYAASATIPFMPTGQQDRLLALWKKAVRCLAGVHPQDDVLPLIRNLKLTLLSHHWSPQLFTTIRRCYQQSAPGLLLEKLSFHEHQHSTRGRQQGDFRPFQPASLAGRISFTNRAPPLWNMLPREVQTSSSMLVFKKNVSSLLDSPASGKNLLQICFGNTTI